MPNFDLFLNITIKILIAILLVVGIYVSIQFSNKRLENGEKIKLKSGNYKSRKVNLNDWNEPDKAKEWRENFSKKANE